MPLKVLVHGLNYAPEPTGTGKYTAEMAAWLAERGHEVDALVGVPHYPAWKVFDGYGPTAYRTERVDGVRVFRAPHYVPSPEHVTATGRILLESSFSLSGLRYWLPRFLRTQTYDVLIGVCPPLQMGLYPALYSRLRGVPWVFHVQDLQVDAAVRLGILDGRLSTALYLVEERLLAEATIVSTITEAMRRRCVDKGVDDERTYLLPNWADIEFVRPAEKNNSFRRELGIAPDQVLCLYSGNMGEKQGLELVLEVASRLREHANIRFVMVGAGAAKSRLERQASAMALPNLRFLELQPWARVPEMLAAGDIHLVVQREEAADLVMPSKLTNTLAAGRCVVATAAEGTALHHVVAECGIGRVCKPEDADGLETAIVELATDKCLRHSMGSAARSYAERHLDRDAILGRFEAKLFELVEGTARRHI